MDMPWETVTSRKGKKKQIYGVRTAEDVEAKDKDAYRIEAIEWIKSNHEAIVDSLKDSADTVTYCAMFYQDTGGELDHKVAYSGSPIGKVTNLRIIREEHEISKDKETVCAEEHMIANYPEYGFLFSISYSKDHGYKYACGKGCATLLKKRQIEDLAAFFHKKKRRPRK